MKRSLWVVSCLVGLIGGLGGETLLFFESQCARVEEALKDDFRILLFLKSDVDEGRRKVLDEKLLALPDVEGIRYVSSGDALAELRRRDPELAESALIVGDNPLSPAYELRLSNEGFGRVPALIAAARAVEGWADVRYKPAQVRSILQAQYCRHLLAVVFSAMLCLVLMLALAALWRAGRGAGLGRSGASPVEGGAGWGRFGWGFRFPAFSPAPLAAAAGAAAGAGLTALIAIPIKLLTSWWAWPSLASQAVLVAGAAVAGWVLCGRGD